MAAVNIDKMIPEYVSDWGSTYNIVPFKIKEGYEERAEVATLYGNRPGFAICGPGGLFELRKLEVTFINEDNDLDVVLFPIPLLSQVNSVAEAFVASADVLCVNYIGERWKRVPSAIHGGTFNPAAELAATAPGARTSGSLPYATETEGFGSPLIPVLASFETEPDNVSAAIAECIPDLIVGGFCNESAGLRSRRLIFKARRTGAPGQFVVRTVPIGSLGIGGGAPLRSCVAALDEFFVCVSYEGERRRNLQNFLAPVTIA